MDTSTPHSDGFSLVELSIVLVILGLLVGGIMTGQNLIRAAEIRSVSVDLDAYRTAIHIFKDKYFALPGDMKNAVKFWGPAAGGTADGEDATCVALDYTSPSTGTETCNGNGDGKVQASGEMMRFWQHLANAGLIPGHYTGVSANGNTNRAHRQGLNCPASKIGRAGFSLYNMGTVAPGSAYLFPGHYGHAFMFGTGGGDYETIGSIISPEEAWNIDTKLDDGNPATGTVRPRSPGSSGHPNCSTSTDPDVSIYNTQYTSIACGLYFITGL